MQINKKQILNLAKPLSFIFCVSAFAASHENPEIIAGKIHFLQNFNLEQEGLTFKQLGGGTTPTNWRVKAPDGSMANLKCSAGNTNSFAAPATFGIGALLDFNIYPVAINVRTNIKVNGTDLSNKSCALKEWSSHFAQLYWKREASGQLNSTASQNVVMKVLQNCDQKLSSEQAFSYSANTDFGSPKINDSKTLYIGETSLMTAAKDFSNMMLVDVIIGNDDRFPGGNVQFRSTLVNQNFAEKDSKIFFLTSRLFSLDNEAAFKSMSSYNARKDLLKIRRFDQDMLSKIANLKTRILQNDPVTNFLNFRLAKENKSAREFVVANIDYILKYAASDKTCRF